MPVSQNGRCGLDRNFGTLSPHTSITMASRITMASKELDVPSTEGGSKTSFASVKVVPRLQCGSVTTCNDVIAGMRTTKSE